MTDHPSPPPSPLEPFRVAINDGNVARARQLFEQYPELDQHVNDQVFPFDRSAIFVCRANLPLVDLLLSHGADINQKTSWWAGGFGILEDTSEDIAAPLIQRGAIVNIWAAVSLNHMDRVVELLDEDPALVKAPGGDGKHPLHYAPDVTMVDFLVSRGADVDARDVDHTSTPAHYLIDNEPVVRRLLEQGAEPDLFMAAALGDAAMSEHCIGSDPDCVNHRLGAAPWTNDAGGFIYNWTLGHDLTPYQVAKQRHHAEVARLIQEASSPQRQLVEAIWDGDQALSREILNANPQVLDELADDDRRMLARAAWWYRPAAVRLMLALGFDPHVYGVHRSTPLDRAAFHGFADIVQMLLEHDPAPPLEFENEFGGTPLAACIYGANHGWDTGHPQDHVKTVELLMDAGAERRPEWLPTGHDAIDAALKSRVDGGDHVN